MSQSKKRLSIIDFLPTEAYKDLFNTLKDDSCSEGYLHRRIHRFVSGRNCREIDIDRLRAGLDRRVIEILPGIFELDPLYIDFKCKLYQRLVNLPICTIDHNTGGLTGDGIYAGEFDCLLSNMSVFPEPFGYPPLIPATRSPDESMCQGYELMAREFFSAIYTTNAQLRTESSSGFPFMSADITLKIRVIRYLIEYIRQHGWASALTDFPLVYILGFRKQAENPSKERVSYDINGNEVKADKFADIPTNLRTIADSYGLKLGSARNRIIYAGSVVNMLFTIISQGFRNRYLHKYASTFHFDSNKCEQLLQMKYIYSSDIKNYDQHYPREYAWTMYKAFANALGEDSIYTYLKDFDILAPDFEASATKPPVFLSHVRQDLYSGNNSGVPIVKELGVAGCLAEMLASHARCGLIRSVDCFSEFLSNAYLPRFMNMNGGDDHIIGFQNKRDHDAIEQDLADHSFFEIKKETPTKFLGHAVYHDSFGRNHFILTMNGYIKRRFCPEYSYFEHDVFNGDKERDRLYSKHPSFEKVRKIRDDTFKEVFGVTYYDKLAEANDYNNRIEAKLAELGLTASELSDIELEVLEDPSKLQWKFKMDELAHPEIGELFFTSIPFNMDASYSHGISVKSLLSLCPNSKFDILDMEGSGVV